MSRKRQSDDELRALVAQGLTAGAIAKKLGIKINATYMRLARSGLKAASARPVEEPFEPDPEPAPKAAPKPKAAPVKVKIVMPELRPRVIATREPPPRSQRVEFSKPELQAMLRKAVENTK